VRLKTDKFPSMFPSVSPGSDFRCSIGPFSPELVILKEVKDLRLSFGVQINLTSGLPTVQKVRRIRRVFNMAGYS
jgi:hypothetical protein